LQGKQSLSQADKKIIGGLLIGLLALITVASLVYWVSIQSNQTDNTIPNSPSPEPTPMSTPPTSTPYPTTTPVPNGGLPANLVCNVNRLDFIADGGLRLLIYADIVNTGTQTAYNVSLHIETWFSDGAKGIDDFVRLNDEVFWILPFKQVDIAGGETYSLKSRYFSALEYSVPYEFWLDEHGTVFPYDLISSYVITPLWDNAP
jgi:hypothetical protein